MGRYKSWSRKGKGRHHAAGAAERVDGTGEEDGSFELYLDHVWEDDDLGRFAESRWSERPKKRRSQWLRERLADAQFDDDRLYLDRRA